MRILKLISLLSLFVFHLSWAGGDFPFPLWTDSNFALINAWQIQDMNQVVSLYQSNAINGPWILAIQNIQTREFLTGKAINPGYHIKETLNWNNDQVQVELNLHAEEFDSPGSITIKEHKYQLFFNTIFCQSL